jgi:ABC-type transport system involved in cytochrome c biogenesis permease component
MIWVNGKPAQLGFLIIAVVALALFLANISLASVEKALAQRKPTMATRRQNVLLETIKLPMDMIPLMLNVVALIMLFKADQHLDTVQYYLSWCFGVSLLVFLISTVSLTRVNLRLRQKLVTAHEDDFPANPPDAAA